MDSSTRRQQLQKMIASSPIPLTGGELSEKLNVSRQVIVQDVALLRASGCNIVATPSGYILIDQVSRQRPVRVFTCRHLTIEETERELMIMVENGGRVRDVIIEHPVYGEISGNLMLSTREAVTNLIGKLKQKNSAPLSLTTDGIHLHTVEGASEEILNKIEQELRLAGILYTGGFHGK